MGYHAYDKKIQLTTTKYKTAQKLKTEIIKKILKFLYLIENFINC